MTREHTRVSLLWALAIVVAACAHRAVQFDSKCEREKDRVEEDMFAELFDKCSDAPTPEECVHFESIRAKYAPRRDAAERACL